MVNIDLNLHTLEEKMRKTPIGQDVAWAIWNENKNEYLLITEELTDGKKVKHDGFGITKWHIEKFLKEENINYPVDKLTPENTQLLIDDAVGQWHNFLENGDITNPVIARNVKKSKNLRRYKERHSSLG